MTLEPTRIRQILFLAGAAVLLTLAYLMQTHGLFGSKSLNKVTEENQLVVPGNKVQENHPELVLLETMPGGLRALAVNYFWIRAEELKNDGKYYESRQLSKIICDLMPRQPGVWGYQAWNNAFNISVATHTPEERWLWVTDGMRLLRDKGIPLNPRTMDLYKELTWIFWMKMGGTLDDMHWVYKSRWAGEMQFLLAAPPLGTHEDVMAAFRPIQQEQLLDKSDNRQGEKLVQPEKLDDLLANNPDIATYVNLLKQAGMREIISNGGNVQDDWTAELDQRRPTITPKTFLPIYHRFSHDECITGVRLVGVKPESDRDIALSALINDPKYAAPRARLLAFLRAQVLWNAYRMDADWMMDMMKLYGPLDWRTAQAHGLYWITYGFHVCERRDLKDIATNVAAAAEMEARIEAQKTGMISINSDRILFNCLKDLTFFGHMTLLEDQQWGKDPRGLDVLVPCELRPTDPVVIYSADWRFIDPLVKVHDQIVTEVTKKENRPYEENSFRTGHINYMVSAIRLLYMMDKPKRAQELYDQFKNQYKLTGGAWDKDLDGMLTQRLKEEGRPIASEASAQVTAGLVSGLSYLALGSDKAADEKYKWFINHAMAMYNAGLEGSPDRTRMRPFRYYGIAIASNLLIRPDVYGVKLDLQDRSKLWRNLPDDWRCHIWLDGRFAQQIYAQCVAAGIPMQTAFPEPPNMKAFVQKLMQDQAQATPPPQEQK